TEDHSLVDCPCLEPMSEDLIPHPNEGRREVVPITLRTVSLLAGVFCDCLPATVPGEDQISDRPLGHILAVQIKVVAPSTLPPGLDTHDLADLRWDDPMECLMALSGTSLLWLGFFARVPSLEADGSPVAVLLGFPQDPLELLMDLPASLGR